MTGIEKQKTKHKNQKTKIGTIFAIYTTEADKTADKKHMNALVTPIEHVDVRGNKLLYLKIQGPNGETVVNIGQKTFDGVNKILQPRTESTTVNVLQPEIPGMQKERK